MIFKQQKNKDHVFLKGGNLFTIRDISNLIREGNSVQVTDENGFDNTSEFLMRAAFGRFAPKGDLRDYLLKKINDDELIEIIENGGIENYLIRSRE